MFPVAFDLLRFSGMEQEKGDSTRRQDSLADRWSKRTGIPIDLTLVDEGASGWGEKGARRWQRNKAGQRDDSYALAQFLKLIESGRVQPGDYLLLENLDRLSREKEVPATHLLTSILMAGVKVVQLAPHELELTADSDMFTIFRAVMELSRGHGESQRKHQVCSASYANNREGATACECGHRYHRGPCPADGCGCQEFVCQEFYQGSLPAWVRREGKGKGARKRRLVLITERAAVVRRIFLWAAAGMSCGDVVRKLIADKVPPFGNRKPRLDPKTGKQTRSRTGMLRWQKDGDNLGAGHWTRSYVAGIINDRAAVGELATRTGEVIPIPAAITEEEWLAAQSGSADRRKRHGRKPAAGPEALFSSLLTDAQSGHPYYARTLREDGYTWRVLVRFDPREKAYRGGSFPEPIFEQAILSCLEEIDPAEVTGRDGPDQVAVLNGRIEHVRARLAELEEQGKECEKLPKRLVKMMAELEDEEAALEEERRQAQQAAAHPLSETWGQAQSLLGVLDTAEKRLRLRALLRQMVEEIRLLVVPRGWDRVAAVQMRFRGSDQVRSYLIVYRKGVMPNGRKAQRRKAEKGTDLWAVRSLADVHKPGDLDLRQRQDAAALEQKLLALDLAPLTAPAAAK
jgi:hypothetical protein